MSKTPPSRTADKLIVRLPDGMRDKVAAAAKAKDRSSTAEVVFALEAWLDPIAPFPLRMPLDLRRRIEKAAAAHKYSMNSEIVDTLSEYYPPEQTYDELLSLIDQLLDDSLGNDWRRNREFLTESLRELRDRIQAETPDETS